MSLQSSRGSFCSLLVLYFCSSGWVGVSAGAGQNKEVRVDEVLSALPLLLLLLAACPAPAVPECPLKVAHATSFMSPWAGVKLHSPSLAAWKGSNQGTVRHSKEKTNRLPLDFSSLENGSPQHPASLPQCHCGFGFAFSTLNTSTTRT